MKKNLLYILMLFISCGMYAQDAAKINDDTVRIKLGEATLLIIDDEPGEEDEFDFDIDEGNDDHDGDHDDDGGLVMDIGMNGYLTPNYEITLPESQNLMQLNYSRSRSFGLTKMLMDADIIEDRLYISPGIGVNWNNYFFKNTVNISTGNDSTTFQLDSVYTYDKYKLRVTYLQVPLIIGVRLGDLDKRPLGLQVGAIGSFKIGSMVKQKYSMNETNFKDKIRDDYNLNPFKLEAIARISVGNMGIFARYSLTSLFETGKAPDLYPFSAGITFGGF